MARVRSIYCLHLLFIRHAHLLIHSLLYTLHSFSLSHSIHADSTVLLVSNLEQKAVTVSVRQQYTNPAPQSAWFLPTVIYNTAILPTVIATSTVRLPLTGTIIPMKSIILLMMNDNSAFPFLVVKE